MAVFSFLLTGCLLGGRALGVSPTGSCVEDGSCPAREVPGQDHSLFQVARRHQAQRISHDLLTNESQEASWTCLQSAVTRRRRAHAMCSCRRRSGSADLPAGLRCDGAANRIVKEEETAPPPPTAGGCQPTQVTRRRRAASMCSCRRRSGWQDLPAGMRCDGEANVIVNDGSSPPTAPPGVAIGWSPTSELRAAGKWCEVGVPPQDWTLKACPARGTGTNLKVLTYNLFWWNLFGKRGGNGKSAGRKIAQTSGPEQYDLMGFQECDDMHRILGDARDQGLSGDYTLLNGGRALAVAWRSSRFTLLADGKADVGEDHHSQYYGKRAAQWVRLLHQNGQTVFFLNHHGPLPVSKSGGCTGSATAYNILRLIAQNAQTGDLIVVVGDFNAQPHSSRIQALDNYLHRVYTGDSMGGVDHILSNCAASNTANLGSGGSDHDALSAVFQM